MTVQLLLREFGRVADAPKGIARLRQVVLNLAVRGKLVPVEPNDGRASDLLRQMQRRRAGNPNSGSLAFLLADPPYEIPAHWEWTRLGDTLDGHVGGGTPSKSNSEYWGGSICWASVKDIGNGKELFSTIDRITEVGLANSSSNLIPPGRLIVVTRIGLGKVSINRVPVAINQDLRALTPSPLMEIGYQYIFLKTHGFEGTGLTVKGIRLDELLRVPFPLPPPAEQRRIEAKVDELMALCDELEAAQAEREVRRGRLRLESLHRLTPQEGAGIASVADVRFFLRQAPRLITKPEHMPAIRQTILDLAVRGRIVPQDPQDAPVSQLLRECDQIRAEASRRDRRAIAERQDLLGADLRWRIPIEWEWRGLADLALFIDYRGHTPTKVAGGIRLITAKNVRRGRLSRDPEEFISEQEYKHWMTRGLPKLGDVLFTTEAPMGNAAVVRVPERFALAQRVINFRPYGAIDPDFLVLQLTSQPFQRILEETSTGLTAKGIKAAKLKRLPLAVPPLAEQRRIVAGVSELTEICDQLEAALSSAQVGMARLLEAILHEALNRPASQGSPRSAHGQPQLSKRDLPAETLRETSLN